MRRWIRQLHENRSGAIGVLVLLTIWCLVALIGMLWNTAEYSVRRQNIQSAADSAAHAAATWMSRCLNITAAQNMLIAQNGSAEVISRAVLPTYTSLLREINREYILINNPNLKSLQSRLPGLLAAIDKNYALLTAAMQDISADVGAITFPDKNAAADYSSRVRQLGVAVNWVEGTYVNGNPPQGNNPGPPAGPGVGLRQLVEKWTTEALTEPMRLAIIASLKEQGPPTVDDVPQVPGVLLAFQKQTESSTGESVWTDLQKQEQAIFKNEKQAAGSLPDTVAQQISQIAAFYNVTIQLSSQFAPASANQDGAAASIDHSQVQASVMDQAKVDGSAGLNHSDSIRVAHPELNLPTSVDIDPINPNTGIYESDGASTLNLRLVDAGSEIIYPAQTIPTYILRVPQVTINCNPRFGGWGHSWIFPIERYFGNRVSNDMRGLQSQFFSNGSTGIDDLRLQLAQLLDQLAGVNGFNIPGPASTINDTQTDPATGGVDSIRVLPDMTLPANAKASAKIRTDIDFTYKTAAASYMGAVQRLAAVLRQFGAFYNQFTVPIAVPTWQGKIDNATIIVAQELGQAEKVGQIKDPNKGFMVLRTYQLWNSETKQLPETWWATVPLNESLRAAILTQIITYNINQVGSRFLNAGMPDPWGTARAVIANSGQIQEAAQEIAAEMVSRPWPYEKTPPQVTVPPTRGMDPDDRKQYFSVLAAAQTNGPNDPKLILPAFFGKGVSLSAYAQAETFNWMEYNDSYGGYATEKFDELSGNVSAGWTPVVTGFIACPRAWRLASVGGWNWQPRLSFADMLGQAISQDPDFAATLKTAGINAPAYDPASDPFTTINAH